MVPEVVSVAFVLVALMISELTTIAVNHTNVTAIRRILSKSGVMSVEPEVR